MNKKEIADICREVIYECFPDMEGTPLYEDTVISRERSVLNGCRLSWERHVQ